MFSNHSVGSHIARILVGMYTINTMLILYVEIRTLSETQLKVVQIIFWQIICLYFVCSLKLYEGKFKNDWLIDTAEEHLRQSSL